MMERLLFSRLLQAPMVAAGGWAQRGLVLLALLVFGLGAASPTAAQAEGRKLYMPIGSERLLSFDLPFGQV